MNVKETTKFVCPVCFDTFDKRAEAEECCELNVMEEYRYYCGSCDKEYGTVKLADRCCRPVEVEDLYVYSPFGGTCVRLKYTKDGRYYAHEIECSPEVLAQALVELMMRNAKGDR